MPANIVTSVENNFTKGLITEATGLNFPENAATDADNVEFTLVGDVVRRLGIDIESTVNTTTGIPGVGRNTFVWTNAGGDGNTRLFVRCSGRSINFYDISTATNASPLSGQILTSVVDVSSFVAVGGVFDSSLECTFASGNGYLFVYHPSCDPIFCTFIAGVVTANVITVQIRDFAGISEPSLPVNTRPTSLSNEHLYNLTNQGWSQGSPWFALSATVNVVATGSELFTVPASLTVTLGNIVQILNDHDAFPGGIFQPAGRIVMSGTVIGYTGTSMTINITSVNPVWAGSSYGDWAITPSSVGYLNTWNAAIGNYPSNADVWWLFKNTSGVFDPATTINTQTLNTGPAPNGHFILNAFAQTRSLASGVSGLTDVTTTVRPRTGTWFQGRVWFAGVDAQQNPTGDATFSTWTENLYFSQIVTNSIDFGHCYQTNDPTSDQLNSILPTDGGVVVIPDSGSVYKLFPIANGLLVFAANGIWFITGSQGIGFSAIDYTVTKISSVQSISSTSFVDVNGLPYFWNEEGIYMVQPKQGGGLSVDPITVGTILTFFDNIPKASKKYVKGAYHPIDYVIQWTYRSTQETDISDRYNMDSILNYNTFNKAFFPYSVSATTGSPFIEGVSYISYPQAGSDVPDPSFKYPMHYTSLSTTLLGIAEEVDENFVDWNSIAKADYVSFFITGYKVHGKGIMRFQVPYLYIFTRNTGYSSFGLQSIWDFGDVSADSNKWSQKQFIELNQNNTSVSYRRVRLRGRGLAMQIKVSSTSGQPFDIMGWAMYETINSGV